MSEHEKVQASNGEKNINQPEDGNDKNIDREETISSEGHILPETAAVTTTEQSSTINTQLSTEQEKQVHHHDHASQGKKSWKSYFWEFLMLFLAVFCGYLAEYVNRQFNKRSRMNNYLRVMLQTNMRASNLLETIRKEYHLK